MMAFRNKHSNTSNRARIRWRFVIPLVWFAGVACGLVLTLASLRETEFDGLNNLAQIPFALPWWLVVPAGEDHVVNAWVTAGLGVINGLLILLVALMWPRRHSS